MLYSTPPAQNPLIGPRTYGHRLFNRPKPRRGLGAVSAPLWRIELATRGGTDTLYSPGNSSIPLTKIGLTRVWTVLPNQVKPNEVFLTTKGGAVKLLTFTNTTPSRGAPTMTLVSTRDFDSDPNKVTVPPGYKNLGLTSDMAAMMRRLSGVGNPYIADASENGILINVLVQQRPYNAWATKQDITFADPNVGFIGKRTWLVDLNAGDTFHYDWREGSGSGGIGGILGTVVGAISDAGKAVGKVIEPVAAPLEKAATIFSTGGLSEILTVTGDTGQQIQQGLEHVVGGTQIGAGAGFVTSGFNPAGAVAGGVSGAVTGITGAIEGKSAADVLGGATVGGAISGAAVGITSAASKALTATPPVPEPASFSVPSLTPDTAGSTLLPKSLSLIQAPPPPSLVLAGPVAPITFAEEVAIPHLPPPPGYAAYQGAGSTLLPPNLSYVQPPYPFGYNPYLPLPWAGPDSFAYNLPPGPGIDQAGSTLLPPDLSLVPPETMPPVSPPSLLADIGTAAKAAIPATAAGYKLYQQLTSPKLESSGGGGDAYIFADPNAQSAPKPAPKPSMAGPVIAGISLLILMAGKAKRHAFA